MSGSSIVFLGTSAGTPTPSEWFPSILVTHGGVYLLLDAGEGAQIRMLETGIGPGRLDIIAITHMHGDHVFGLPGLIQSMSMSARSRPLFILGPVRLRTFLDQVFNLTDFVPGFPIEFAVPPRRFEIAKGNSVVRLEPFPVCHVGESYGYKVEGFIRGHGGLKKRFSVAYTGDTRPCDEYLRHIEGVDILVHDATFSQKTHGREVWEYGHSTAVDAAEVARRARVSVLVLFHKSVRYQGRGEGLLDEAKKVFPNTILAEDGMRLLL